MSSVKPILDGVTFKETETDQGTEVTATLLMTAHKTVTHDCARVPTLSIANCKDRLGWDIAEQLYGELREAHTKLIGLLRNMNPDPRYPAKAEDLAELAKIEQQLKTLLW